MLSDHVYDVLVIGGGNAALCAAISARESGASVLVLEHAPKPMRGGNSRHTRNMRVMHEKPLSVLTDVYAEEDYYADLLRVTGGQTNEELARLTIRQSGETFEWIEHRGVQFQPSLSGTLGLSATNAFFLGGGKALLNALYHWAERIGIVCVYDSEVQDLILDDGFFLGAKVVTRGFPETIKARSLVVASGGFQANIAWMKDYWGEGAENFIIRGTPYAKGRVLKSLLDKGAARIGDPTQCHAIALDARGPKFDGGIVTRTDCVPFSAVLNQNAERFYDEGEDMWPKRYAIWGRLIAQQPNQIAYAFLDSKAESAFMPSVYPPYRANTIGELAEQFGIDPDKAEKTIAEFNQAVQPGTFNEQRLDDCTTQGLSPPKSHWARRIDTPPFLGYPLRPGITFTYLGVKVDEQARIHMADGKPSANLFAAGEVMAGNILGKGYLAGIGMTIGSVFGRIAGREAARYVRN
ncbi:MAG: FAD-dependent tricarballylate dehydrogenase TcuA [Methylocystaceae bacterium]|nr:FAD-dependent tricarballylate dehydrogenase TcuA [Methylocystaceae bacterium]